MGMTIDKTIEFFNGLECHTPQAKDARNIAVDTMRKYQMMQADYNARLQADLVAMLTELQLELDEMKITKVRSAGFAPYSKDPFRRGVNCSKEIIQQKINALKGDSDGA
jgi:hypothetical protein